MPLLIPTDELQVGMRLHEPIISNGRVMLQGGRILNSADIGVIRRRYSGMRVRISDPVLDSVVDFEDDSRERRIAAEAQQRVAKCLAAVHGRFRDRMSFARVDFGVVQATVTEVIEYLKANPTSAALVVPCLDPANYLGTHTGNVFYLSVLLGASALEYVVSERKRAMLARDVRATFAMDLTPLGLGAMSMDLGMLPLQPLFQTRRPLTDAEREMIREHPNVSYEMLPESFSSVARVIVKTHHENAIGTGYPKGLPSDKVHVFSRILRIADAFDAATSERVYRGAKSAARVLWEMTAGPYRRFYDPKLIETFAGLIQPFPIGSKLRLTDGRYAAVVRYNRAAAFDPVVVIAFDAQNRPLPREKLEGPLRLSTRAGLRVASLGGEDLSFLYDNDGGSGATPSATFTDPLQAMYP